jgi:acid phosphatase type 7
VGPWVTQLGADEAAVVKFRAATEHSFPNMDAYSFDYGAAHFVVFNNNKGVSSEDPAFRKWLADDLKASKAKWKIVCFHVPGFQSSRQHYTEQQIRLLQPLFEECGVDLAFGGHVHNYQRGVPLKFAPEGERDKKGRVYGKFTLDEDFDGVQNTQPKGVIHFVAGGGGASLYGPGLEKVVPVLKKEHAGNYANYTAKMVADQHTFVVLDVAPERLEVRAVGAKGDELDHITITKGK